ncbi:hypothetical protein HDU93_004823 [Gonapodya sp. JEL0774]|nr:hypothetical protein HDU93_004823 [Gonapodya sp. JEL0774]
MRISFLFIPPSAALALCLRSLSSGLIVGVGAQSLAQDCAVFEQLYTQSNIALPWTPGNCCTSRDPNITCTAGRVTQADLWTRGLKGPIPSLAQLSQLRDLGLGNNQLTGSIPPLASLANLRYLHLGQNLLTGPVPSLASLQNLQYLWLYNNQLSGNIDGLIPPSVATCVLSQNPALYSCLGDVPAACRDTVQIITAGAICLNPTTASTDVVSPASSSPYGVSTTPSLPTTSPTVSTPSATTLLAPSTSDQALTSQSPTTSQVSPSQSSTPQTSTPQTSTSQTSTSQTSTSQPPASPTDTDSSQTLQPPVIGAIAGGSLGIVVLGSLPFLWRFRARKRAQSGKTGRGNELANVPTNGSRSSSATLTQVKSKKNIPGQMSSVAQSYQLLDVRGSSTPSSSVSEGSRGVPESVSGQSGELLQGPSRVHVVGGSAVPHAAFAALVGPLLSSSPSVHLPLNVDPLRVEYSYRAKANDELTVNRGDMVKLKVVFKDGWGMGINFATEEYGMLPLTQLPFLGPSVRIESMMAWEPLQQAGSGEMMSLVDVQGSAGTRSASSNSTLRST